VNKWKPSKIEFTLLSLQEFIKRTYELTGFVMYYVDVDGDKCHILDDEDLEDALKEIGKTLKVMVGTDANIVKYKYNEAVKGDDTKCDHNEIALGKKTNHDVPKNDEKEIEQEPMQSFKEWISSFLQKENNDNSDHKISDNEELETTKYDDHDTVIRNATNEDEENDGVDQSEIVQTDKTEQFLRFLLMVFPALFVIAFIIYSVVAVLNLLNDLSNDELDTLYQRLLVLVQSLLLGFLCFLAKKNIESGSKQHDNLILIQIEEENTTSD